MDVGKTTCNAKINEKQHRKGALVICIFIIQQLKRLMAPSISSPLCCARSKLQPSVPPDRDDIVSGPATLPEGETDCLIAAHVSMQRSLSPTESRPV